MSEGERHRIRVLHLGSPTGLYGAERWILALARYLPVTDVESWVGVIEDAPDQDAPLCRHASRLGLRTQVFAAHGRLSLAAIGQIRSFMREQRIQVLHTHGYKTDIIGCLAARGTSCKVIATPHGWGASPGVRMHLYEGLDRLMLRLADAVVPLSTEMVERLRRLPGMQGRLHFIPNGVDLAEVDSPAGPCELLEERRAGGELVIGSVGRLDRGKRLDTLIRAFHLLPLPRKHLCVIGEGPERRRLESLAAALVEPGEVTFLGFRDDRIGFLRSFDVFVLPSEREGMPRCLLEAMAAGIAAIAADIPGCRELMDGNANGLLFRPGDAVGLSRQMLRLAEDPALRERLARRGREHIRRLYSAKAMADSYCELYERLLGPIGAAAPA